MGNSQIKKFCALESTGQEMLRHAMEDLQLSAQAYDRILTRIVHTRFGRRPKSGEHDDTGAVFSR